MVHTSVILDSNVRNIAYSWKGNISLHVEEEAGKQEYRNIYIYIYINIYIYIYIISVDISGIRVLNTLIRYGTAMISYQNYTKLTYI